MSAFSDVEARREAVVVAARECVFVWRGSVRYSDLRVERARAGLVVAVRELDVALVPDPWVLLERIRAHDVDPDVYSASDLNVEIDAALAWRLENRDD